MEKKRRETPEKEKKEWGKTSKKCGNACENMNAWKEVWKLGPEGSVETRTGRKCGSQERKEGTEKQGRDGEKGKGKGEKGEKGRDGTERKERRERERERRRTGQIRI